MNIALGGAFTGGRYPGHNFDKAVMEISDVTVTKTDHNSNKLSLGGSNVITQSMIDYIAGLMAA